MAIEIEHLEPIGRGYFGTVYQGNDTDLNRSVAIKFFDSTEDRYITEMRTHVKPLLEISHPNVLQIYQIAEVLKPGNESPENAIVMEFVDGVTLHNWKLEGPHDFEICKDLVTQLVNGVLAFHEAPNPHGDLHARNVLISGNNLKIIDPYCVGSSVVFSTVSESERYKYDARMLCNLICEILSASDNLQITQKFSILFADELESVQDVLLRVESLFSAKDLEFANHFEYAQKVFESGSVREKRGLISRSLSVVSANMESWEAANSGVKIDKETCYRVSREVSSQCDSALSVLLAGCVSGGTDTSHLRIARFMCRKDFAGGSGLTAFVNLPLSVAAGSIRMAGAAALLSGNDTQIQDLISKKIRFRRSNPATIFENKCLSGWPSSLGGNCVNAWKFWLDAYSWSKVLQSVFVTRSEYHAAMFGFSMFATFASVSSSLKAGVDPGKIIPDFAPMQMSYFGSDVDDVLDEYLDMMERFENKIPLATYLFGLEEEELDEYWEKYRLFYMKFLASIEDWYYDIPSLLEENPFAL